MRSGAALLAAAAALALATTGCGAEPTTRAPPEAARRPVLQFLAALRDGRPAAACALASQDLQRHLRDDALSGVRVHPGSLKQRLAEVRTEHARARTCTGAVAMLAEQHAASLAAITTRARSMPLRWLGPPAEGSAMLGDQDWVFTRHGDRWQLDIVNAL